MALSEEHGLIVGYLSIKPCGAVGCDTHKAYIRTCQVFTGDTSGYSPITNYSDDHTVRNDLN